MLDAKRDPTQNNYCRIASTRYPTCGVGSCWMQFYESGLAAASGVFGLFTAWMSQDWHWIVGASLIVANWPYSCIRIMLTAILAIARLQWQS